MNTRLVLPAEEIELRFSRSGGPGGQNVNKVETQVELRFAIPESAVLGETRRDLLLARLAPRLTQGGVLIVRSSRTRERGRNLEDARERLAALLREALVPRRARRATKPTRASQRRRVDEKRHRSRVKRERRRGED